MFPMSPMTGRELATLLAAVRRSLARAWRARRAAAARLG
jgi:hypothetical protein